MLAGSCRDCEIVVGEQCVPCPNGVDFPECAGCVNGERVEPTDVSRDLVLPIIIGVATTLAVALIIKQLK